MSSKTDIEKLLAAADIKINGPRDFDIQVHNEKVYDRVLSGGSLAAGESYMDSWWDVKNPDQFFYRIFKAQIAGKFSFSLPNLISFLKAKTFNLQTESRASIIGEKHYDTGNDLYQAMLGKSMAYSCGYWKDTNNLDEAQFAKYDLICRKIGLKPGQRILDIGCGWGGLLKYAAEKYGAKGVGITVSKEQAEFAKKACNGLDIEILLEDYRSLEGKFDHVVSVGMFEHVGVKNYRMFMKTAHKLLKDDGLFLLHSIGSKTSSVSGDPWIEKYIFPNSMLPSVSQIGKAAEGLFVMEDWHNFGAYYDKTLMAWFENFNNAWPSLKSAYSERFYRMWKFYLLSCAANFRARNIELWQVVFSKEGVEGGYNSVR